ncbi:MAG: hypothetical protein GKR96_02865 [Gammaproteobacteria bacterium]|nr:hypothetical protein [Gammaproteobacteria bacterium]
MGLILPLLSQSPAFAQIPPQDLTYTVSYRGINVGELTANITHNNNVLTVTSVSTLRLLARLLMPEQKVETQFLKGANGWQLIRSRYYKKRSGTLIRGFDLDHQNQQGKFLNGNVFDIQSSTIFESNNFPTLLMTTPPEK